MTRDSAHYSAKIDTGALVDEQLRLLDCLVAAGQSHLFEAWDVAGKQEDLKVAMIRQLSDVDRTYSGGITGYINNARRLLNEGNAFSGLGTNVSIEQPTTVDLTHLDDNYRRTERLGLRAAYHSAFVLVAGGLGERLGYDGIKMEIPVELTTLTTYLGLYCRTVKAIQDRVNRIEAIDLARIPFLIMTSDGTCDRLKAHLGEHEYFGLSPEQVYVFEQRLVPSLADKEARLATDGPYKLLLRPGGHGDVHAMLHQLGLAQQLADSGKRHLVFIQDTNAQIINLILPALGASVDRQLDFNFVCVPRVPQEPIGAVVRMVYPDFEQTANIEYNQLDELFTAQGSEGARAAHDGSSPYPGNINLLIARFDPYIKTLDRTQGAVAEFINPKYADESKSQFAKPTRIETLMQDIATSLPPDTLVGATLFQRNWALAALKNNLDSSIDLASAGQPSYSAAAAESGFYQSQRTRLRLAGVSIEPGKELFYHRIPYRDGARVVLSPSFSLLLDDSDGRFSNVHISRNAGLVLNGNDIVLKNVRLDGKATLIIHACEGARIRVEGLHLTLPGYVFEAMTKKELQDDHVPAHLRIRGYRRVDHEPVVFRITEPGDYIIGSNLRCDKETPGAQNV